MRKLLTAMVHQNHITAYIAWLAILCCCSAVGTSQTQNDGLVPGSTYWGKQHFVECIAGNLPVIISVPHGGSLTPEFMPDRIFGVTVRDGGTQEVARHMVEEFYKRTGKYPFVVLNNLHRKKLDANREEFEATAEDPVAGTAWNEYHAFIDSAVHLIRKNFGRGLFIDLHGHNHPIEQIEIGYRLEEEDLALSDSCLNMKEIVEKSSMKNLLAESSHSHADIVRGRTSFGALFEKHAIPATPRPSVPVPQSAHFFGGGYNTYRHAVEDAGTMFGVQFELNKKLRRSSECEHTAAVLVDVILEFLDHHSVTINAKLGSQ